MAVRRKRSISIPPELDAEIAAAAQAAGMSCAGGSSGLTTPTP
jgi:hypothetical protein